MKEKIYKYNLDRNSLGILVVLITFINFVLLHLNAQIIAIRQVCALQDNVCVIKGILEIIARSHLRFVLVSLTTAFALIRVP